MAHKIGWVGRSEHETKLSRYFEKDTMSGYCKERKIFELTATKARWWYRRQELPDGFESNEGGMKWYADLFRYFGFEVTKIGSGYLHVKANPGQVWEVLSGRPSDPEIANLFVTASTGTRTITNA